MQIAQLRRDSAAVHANLHELPSGAVVTTKACKIYVPVRFSERGLAELGVETYVVGLFPIVMEEEFYAVCMVNAMLQIKPTSMLRVKIQGIDHYEFSFDAGSVIIADTKLVKNSNITYYLFDEVLSKGRVPWYLNYDDLGNIFDTAKKHADANVGHNKEITHLIVSMIARDKKDRTRYYRSVIQDKSELVTNPPVFIPLRSVVYGATNTVNKLAGSYFNDGTVSALVSPATRVEPIEAILRK